jgi:hypothetical protein
VFFVHPHGALPLSSLLMLASVSGGFAGVCPTEEWRVVCGDPIPGWAESIFYGLGLVPPDRAVLEGLLDRGISLCVYSGGGRELAENHLREAGPSPGVRLRLREGLIDLCCKKGIPAIPLYAAGATDSHDTRLTPGGLFYHLPFGAKVCGVETFLPKADVVLQVGTPCSDASPYALREALEAMFVELQERAFNDAVVRGMAAAWPRESGPLLFEHKLLETKKEEKVDELS